MNANTVPRVRIPLSPPKRKSTLKGAFFVLPENIMGFERSEKTTQCVVFER